MSQYRKYAKKVAIADLVLSILFMLTVIGVVIVAAFAASDKNFQDQLQKEIGSDPNAAAYLNAAIWILIAVVAAYALFTALQMWAAIQLMSATDNCREPVEALRLATTWRNVSILFLTLGIVGLLVFQLNMWYAVNLFLRGAMLYIVFRYMKELEMMLNTPLPVSVTVQK